ncbi:MAG: four helix bundle protein [bacterium]|nr:four helix bundle protein [bacterium]
MNYDLEERTAKFGEAIIHFVASLPKNEVNKILINQVVRSATSIGANYMEANQASSKKDFRNKIGICRKEANETKYWIRMISSANHDKVAECKNHWKEAHELMLIFSKIFSSSSKKVETI